MTYQAVSPLRRRVIEDVTIRAPSKAKLPVIREAMRKRSALVLAIFVAGFFIVWTAWNIVAWKLELVPELARPFLRAAIWISAALIWVRWQEIKAPGAQA